MKQNNLEQTATVLRLLGDKTRLTMLGLMQLKDCCVCEFVQIFNMSQPAISQHMKRLKDAGLVNERKSGKWIIYSINKQNEFYPLLQNVLNHLPSQQQKLDWLKREGLAISCK